MVKRHFPEELETERLTLHKHRLEWAPRMYDAVEADRTRLREYLPWVDFTFSVEDEYAYVHQSQSQWDRFEVYDYSIIRKSDGAYLGHIGVHNISWLGGGCELGYWILGEFEGQGYITEVSRALCDLAFGRGFHRIEIRCSESNSRSAGVPRRLGFRFEARLRESTMNQGEFHDVLIFAMLREEWGVSKNPGSVGHLIAILTPVAQNLATILAELKPPGTWATIENNKYLVTIPFATEAEYGQWRDQVRRRRDRDAAAWKDVVFTLARVEREIL